MVIIQPTEDGNWALEFDWALPEKIEIEDGELRLLRDSLVELFGPGPTELHPRG